MGVRGEEVILDLDPRLKASLPESGKPCGCVWRTFTDRRSGEKVQLQVICLPHRRWLMAILSQMRNVPTSFHPSVKLVGPAYQAATRHAAAGQVPEHVHAEARPPQFGGVVQMDGPLHQPARTVLVVEAPEPEIEEPMDEALKQIMGLGQK
jgi:hypothetical protein